MSARLIIKELIKDCERMYTVNPRAYARNRRCSYKRANRIICRFILNSNRRF